MMRSSSALTVVCLVAVFESLSTCGGLAFKHFGLHSSTKLKSSVQNADVELSVSQQDLDDARLNNPPNTFFDWKKQWYPIAVEEFTDKTKPHHMQILGSDVVLWNDGKSWRVFEDSCPHRGVPLSEGRIEKNGELLCAYHAWTFDGNGQVTSIPQTVSKAKEDLLKLNEKACAKIYPLRVTQGLIWMWGEKGPTGSNVAIEAALKEPRLIEEISDPRYQGRILNFTYNFRDVPYGWDMFMENTLDPAHVVVSHHGIVGNRYKDPQFIDLTRLDSGDLDPRHPDDDGFRYLVQTPQRSSSIAGKSYNDFRPPCLNKIETSFEDGSKLILALYATPTMPGFCRHIGAQILIKNETGKVPPGLGAFALPMPKWLLHMSASFFLHQDQVFLHHQERMLHGTSSYAFGNFNAGSGLTSDPAAYAKTYFMPNNHDKAVVSMRRWIHDKAGGGPKWGPAALARGLPPRLPAAQLFDVYESHTKNCKTCSSALHKARLLRNVSLALVGALVAVSRLLKPAYLVALGALLSLVAFAAHKVVGLYHKYEFRHQDNN